MKLQFEQEKYLMDKAAQMMNDEEASEDEKKLSGQLIRKRTLTLLANIFTLKSKETEDMYIQKGWINASSERSPHNDSVPSTQPPGTLDDSEDGAEDAQVTQHETQEDENDLASSFEVESHELEE